MQKHINTLRALKELPSRTVLLSANGTALQLSPEGDRVLAAIGNRAPFTLEQALGFFAPMTVLDTPKEQK